jgi:uncharacterized protein YceK
MPQPESRVWIFRIILPGLIWLVVVSTLGLFLASLLSGCSTVPIAHNTDAEVKEESDATIRWWQTNQQFNVR